MGSLKKPYLEKTNILVPSIDKNYNLKQWLIDNSDILIKNKNIIEKEIENISNECISWYESINKTHLNRLCLITNKKSKIILNLLFL